MTELQRILGEEKLKGIRDRYNLFIETVNDSKKPPVRVFNPLNDELIDQLMLVREISKSLQKSKEDDIKKAAEAAKEAEETQKAAEAEAEKVDKENTANENN